MGGLIQETWTERIFVFHVNCQIRMVLQTICSYFMNKHILNYWWTKIFFNIINAKTEMKPKAKKAKISV